MPPRPALLCILDGWGWRPEAAADNAITAAHTPNYTRLMAECPHALLATSGHAVGLPKGQMGNSEVGHMNIGAGRIVAQDLPRIDVAIEDGSLARRPVLLALIEKAKAAARAVHVMGLLSPGADHQHGGCAGVCACVSRWPRHAAQKRDGLCREIPQGY